MLNLCCCHAAKLRKVAFLSMGDLSTTKSKIENAFYTPINDNDMICTYYDGYIGITITSKKSRTFYGNIANPNTMEDFEGPQP